MKNESVFQAHCVLEASIRSGDFDAVIAALRQMTAQDREAHAATLKHLESRLQAGRWERDGKAASWWGTQVSQEHLSAAGAALFFCGGSLERSEHWQYQDTLYPHLDLLEAAALRGLATELVSSRPVYFTVAQRLVCDGLSDRPGNDAYILGLMALPQLKKGAPSIFAAIDADPALLDGHLLRLFDVEGTSDLNMSGVEKYSFGNSWTFALLQLAKEGRLDRTQLLDRCIGTLEKDWPQFRSGWFSRFHEQLAPTLDQMTGLSARYLALCHSRIPPTVALALNAVGALVKAGRVGCDDVLDALVPVMSSAVKGQVDAALKLLDAVVKNDPATAHRAAALAQRALAHEAGEVHKKVIARIAAWGCDEATRSDLAAMLPHVSALHRPALAMLVGVAAPASYQLPSVDTHLPIGVLAPLDPSRKLVPLNDIDELVQTIAYVFENEAAIDDFERALEALARLAPALKSAQERFLPVLKRGLKMLAADRDVAGALARMLGAVFDATLSFAALDTRSSNGDLKRRMADLTVFVTRHGGLAPLSSATHQRGFIDPLVLCERIEAHARAGAVSILDEQVRALLRLPAGQGAQALPRLQALAQTPFVQACRYALGDDVDMGDEPALFQAAARIRQPDQDDARVLLAFGDLGPDGAIAARYAWSVAAWAGPPPVPYIVLDVQPAASNPDPSLIAIRRHGIGDCRYFSWGESNLLYAASVLPSSLEAFFADGAYRIGRNIDWLEARWHDKAYLTPLMDPTVPVTPSAVKMIALALGAKEAGQLAVAVDAFVAVLLEERADATQIAQEMRWTLLSLIGKSARYAKSLASAARAHPSMPQRVIGMLCVVLDMGDVTPPKDTGALLELLLELSVSSALELPAGARSRIALLKLTGKGKAAQKELLARFP